MDGEKLKTARTRATMTMRDLEAASGVKLITIWRIENGEAKKSYPSTIRKLAQALGVVPTDLMTEHIARES